MTKQFEPWLHQTSRKGRPVHNNQQHAWENILQGTCQAVSGPSVPISLFEQLATEKGGHSNPHKGISKFSSQTLISVYNPEDCSLLLGINIDLNYKKPENPTERNWFLRLHLCAHLCNVLLKISYSLNICWMQMKDIIQSFLFYFLGSMAEIPAQWYLNL